MVIYQKMASLRLRRAMTNLIANSVLRCSASSNPNIASPIATRFFSSSNGQPIILQGAPQKFKMENPFQLGGPSNVVEVDEVKDATLVRITLPGVGEDAFKVWVENHTLFFTGMGEPEIEDGNVSVDAASADHRRKYGGSLEFSPELYNPDRFEAAMKNGILRLLVPKKDNLEKVEVKRQQQQQQKN